MLPEIKLSANVDVVRLSPLLRGMVMTLSYAENEGSIGLTASAAMNRKFVHWAAVHFKWPDYTVEELYSVNKVLNEDDMPPLQVVRDMLRHLRLLRRKRNTLLATRRGRNFLAKPEAFFDLIATDYLYSYVHNGETKKEIRERMRWWRLFLNLINIKARTGCSLNELANALYPGLSDVKMTAEAWTLKSEFHYGVIRPLCWLGLLYEDREGLTILQGGTFHKTPLWAACLRLESDTQSEIGVH